MNDNWSVTAYDISGVDAPEMGGYSYAIEIETVWFPSEDDCLEWADAMGFLNHDDYEVVIEDPHGTRKIA